MPRIQISREAARALKVAAAMQDKRPHELMEELIFAATATSAQVTTKPSAQKSIAAASIEIKPEKRKRGTFSEEEIDQIKSLHHEGLGAGKIAARMNRGKSGIIYALAAMKKRGEI